MRRTTFPSDSRDDMPGLLAYASHIAIHVTLMTTLWRKEAEHGWTRGQSCSDYGRWGYERYWPSYSAQTGSAGRAYRLDRCATTPGGSAAGRNQDAVAWH